MIRHYITIALRNLFKQKGLAVINMLGLTVGIACFTLFLLYAVNEFSYDRFHANSESVYKVYRHIPAKGGEEAKDDVYLPMPLGPALKQEISGIRNYVRFRSAWGNDYIRINGKVISGPGISYADAALFDVFSFPMKYGNPSQVFQNPDGIVLTETSAAQLFAQENPVGKTLEVKIADAFVPFTVTGVCYDPPSNSSLNFKLLAGMSFFNSLGDTKKHEHNWFRSGYTTYIQLAPGSNAETMQQKMVHFYSTHYPEEKEEQQALATTYRFLPLRDVHTATGIEYSAVDPKTIWMLIAIAAGILLISCINFTTLAIGRSAGRAKEIGVRKVIGGTKAALVIQFLTESVLLSIVSGILGFLLAYLALPAFNEMTGTVVPFSFRQFPELLWMLAALVLAAGLLAGSYPALVLAGFRPLDVLKRKLKLDGANFFTRSLVTVQFTISAGLIISTAIILRQLDFMRSKNPGFEKENIIVIEGNANDTTGIYPLLRQELLRNPHIKDVAGTDISFGEGNGWSRSGFDYKGKNRQVYEYAIDEAYLRTMEIPLLAGKNVDPARASDSVQGVIVNETMMKEFGWTTENAVGQVLDGYSENPRENPVVIGVVRDFNFRPLHEKVAPQMFFQHSSKRMPAKILVRTLPGNPANALDAIGDAWKKQVADMPLQFAFLDDELDRFYKNEDRWSKITGRAGAVCIFLACLGLFGLAALTSVNRTKEIGIRKILGATPLAIVNLVSRQFMRIIIIAVIIAIPLAWYVMNEWLNDFAYRTTLSWWLFAATALCAVCIAYLTIALQTLRATRSNPVKNLRTE